MATTSMVPSGLRNPKKDFSCKSNKIVCNGHESFIKDSKHVSSIHHELIISISQVVDASIPNIIDAPQNAARILMS